MTSQGGCLALCKIQDGDCNRRVIDPSAGADRCSRFHKKILFPFRKLFFLFAAASTLARLTKRPDGRQRAGCSRVQPSPRQVRHVEKGPSRSFPAAEGLVSLGVVGHVAAGTQAGARLAGEAAAISATPRCRPASGGALFPLPPTPSPPSRSLAASRSVSIPLVVSSSCSPALHSWTEHKDLQPGQGLLEDTQPNCAVCGCGAWTLARLD